MTERLTRSCWSGPAVPAEGSRTRGRRRTYEGARRLLAFGIQNSLNVSLVMGPPRARPGSKKDSEARRPMEEGGRVSCLYGPADELARFWCRVPASGVECGLWRPCAIVESNVHLQP